MKIDIKTLITLITISVAIGGFYYSTQDRLEHLEESITKLEKKVNRLIRTNK
tara:strand:- start:1977 stop:2132 length:156 start_codon:yes stop_codon:yes gene_type:complete